MLKGPMRLRRVLQSVFSPLSEKRGPPACCGCAAEGGVGLGARVDDNTPPYRAYSCASWWFAIPGRNSLRVPYHCSVGLLVKDDKSCSW